MTTFNILTLPGDGIGPEVLAEAVKTLKVVAQGMEFIFEEALVGGAALETTGVPITGKTLDMARKSDALLLGAVGGPAWDKLPHDKRPEQALLKLRSYLGLYANLRPVRVFNSLLGSSPLKKEIVQGTDILMVRELTGGIYFGEPRGRNGDRAMNTEVYSVAEVERIAYRAFEAALRRRKKVTSVDKANVLESSILWREVVGEVQKEFPEVELSHMYIDNCAMQLVKNPGQFDVIVTSNLFGDILSDEASMLAGSIGMLPSASVGGAKNKVGRLAGLYEPIHGSAPDIAGQGKANPLGAILSVAMMLELSFGLSDTARKVEKAVEVVLEKGARTADLVQGTEKGISTQEMGGKVRAELERL